MQKADCGLITVSYTHLDVYKRQAVLGARTNNSDMVFNNLREAFKLDNKLVDQAKTDLEFSRFNLSSLY